MEEGVQADGGVVGVGVCRDVVDGGQEIWSRRQNACCYSRGSVEQKSISDSLKTFVRSVSTLLIKRGGLYLFMISTWFGEHRMCVLYWQNWKNTFHDVNLLFSWNIWKYIKLDHKAVSTLLILTLIYHLHRRRRFLEMSRLTLDGLLLSSVVLERVFWNKNKMHFDVG